jgi:DNA-binding CsgD family transcriptional regulator
MDPNGIPETDDPELLWNWLGDTLLRTCDVKGIFYLAYPVGDSGGTPETLILRAIWNTSYPEIYLNALTGNPLTNDYSANHVLQTGMVSRWHDPESPAKMTQGERDRIKLDEQYDMSVGCCFPIYTRSHRICGGFGLRSSSQNAEKFDAMLQQKQETLGKLLLAFDERYRGPYAKTIFKLSPQEIRVLAYLAGGMAVARLAHEMGLSVKTIEAYMASARKKTSSATSAEAVAKAIFFNLV